MCFPTIGLESYERSMKIRENGVRAIYWECCFPARDDDGIKLAILGRDNQRAVNSTSNASSAQRPMTRNSSRARLHKPHWRFDAARHWHHVGCDDGCGDACRLCAARP